MFAEEEWKFEDWRLDGMRNLREVVVVSGMKEEEVRGVRGVRKVVVLRWGILVGAFGFFCRLRN